MWGNQSILKKTNGTFDITNEWKESKAIVVSPTGVVKCVLVGWRLYVGWEFRHETSSPYLQSLVTFTY